MCSKYSDTIAREQVKNRFRKIYFIVFSIIKQIREVTHPTKILSPVSTGWFIFKSKKTFFSNVLFLFQAQTRQEPSHTTEIIIIAIIHIIIAVVILGRFTINNGPLIHEAYYALIDTSNETYTEIPSFFQKIR